MVRAVLVSLVILALVGGAYAAPEKAQDGNLVGVYECEGSNPNGDTYSGIVEIVKLRDTYLVRWTMPDDSKVVGVGIFSGGVLAVSYYGGTPALVVYSITGDDRLEGKWTAGGSEGAVFSETLTRMKEGAPAKPAPRKRDSGPRIRA